MSVRPFLIAGLILFSATTQARIFNFKEAGLGVMLRGSGGLSSVADDPYGNSSGPATTMDDASRYQYSGEIGTILGMSENLNVRLGAEIMRHHPVKGHGRNASDQELFEIESKTFVFHPNMVLEFIFKGGPTTRFFVQAGVGYAMADIENRYAMTATGTGELGVGDFNEKMSGTSISYLLGVGVETSALDNATLSLEAGYRYIKLSELKYTGDVNNIVNPAGAKKGEPALRHDGTQRELDLGGVFVGASLRFYLHFL